MKALSLFSGIGGLDIAAQNCGIETVAFCEIEPFPCEILKKRFPRVPILPDVRKVNGHDFGTVDVIFGGFPCQDLSVAGRKAGLIDSDGNVTRSGLWFEMLRIISECRPRFIVAENVRGAVNAALDVVKSGLEHEGYEVRAVVLPASAFGAPHQRERLFILGVRRDVFDTMADNDSSGLPGRAAPRNGEEKRSKHDDEQSCGCGSGRVWRTPDANADRGAMSEALYQSRIAEGKPISINAQVAHEERNNRKGVSEHSGNGLATTVKENEQSKGQLNPDWVEELMGYSRGWTDPDCDEPGIWMGWPARPGEPQYPYEHPRTVTGMKNRAKRLKALGNSVVPQQAEPIFRTVEIIEKLTRPK